MLKRIALILCVIMSLSTTVFADEGIYFEPEPEKEITGNSNNAEWLNNGYIFYENDTALSSSAVVNIYKDGTVIETLTLENEDYYSYSNVLSYNVKQYIDQYGSGYYSFDVTVSGSSVTTTSDDFYGWSNMFTMGSIGFTADYNTSGAYVLVQVPQSPDWHPSVLIEDDKLEVSVKEYTDIMFKIYSDMTGGGWAEMYTFTPVQQGTATFAVKQLGGKCMNYKVCTVTVDENLNITSMIQQDCIGGDINGNSEIDAADAAALLQNVLNADFATSNPNLINDVNNDGEVTAADAAAILQMVLTGDYIY